MKRHILTVLIILIAGYNTFACIVFSTNSNGKSFAAHNEDSFDVNTQLRFVSASKNNLACVFWGYQKHDYAQGGMNEAGLFWDGTAVPYTEYSPDSEKEEFTEHIFEKVLLTCNSVEQGIDLIQKYNWEAFPIGNFLLADKNGNSVIIGTGKDGKVNFQYRDKSYQVISNFNVFNPSAGGYPDKRYDICSERLERNDDANLKNCRSILGAVHQEMIVQTVYSAVCDLNAGIIHLYYYHNFEDEVIIDISRDTQKGDRLLAIPDMFDLPLFSSYIYEKFSKKPITVKMDPLIEEDNIDEAIALYEELRYEAPSYYTYQKFDFSAGVLNDLTDELIRKEKYSYAIQIAELNLEYYPKSAIAFHLLGDAYAALGKTYYAAAAYKHALALDPENEAVKNKLTEIKSR